MAKRRSIYSHIDWEALQKEVDSGQTVAAVARKHGIDKGSARNHLHGRKKNIADRDAEILRRHAAGERNNAIGRAMGLNPGLVSKVICTAEKGKPDPVAEEKISPFMVNEFRRVGWSEEEIAKEYQCSVEVIRAIPVRLRRVRSYPLETGGFAI